MLFLHCATPFRFNIYPQSNAENRGFNYGKEKNSLWLFDSSRCSVGKRRLFVCLIFERSPYRGDRGIFDFQKAFLYAEVTVHQHCFRFLQTQLDLQLLYQTERQAQAAFYRASREVPDLPCRTPHQEEEHSS